MKKLRPRRPEHVQKCNLGREEGRHPESYDAFEETQAQVVRAYERNELAAMDSGSALRALICGCTSSGPRDVVRVGRIEPQAQYSIRAHSIAF